MTIAITGATGFVGSHVLEQAAAAGRPVRALARSPQPHCAGVEWIIGTLDDAAALDRLCAGAGAVLHVAGAVNVPTRAAFAAANIAGTKAVLAAAARAGIARFVHVSSLAAREPALSNYGWSKAGAEDAVAASDRDWIIVRPPGVYGPRDRDMVELFRMVRRGIALLPPQGRGSWIHAADLARLLLTLSAGGPSQATLEPDDGHPMSHRELAATIGAALGRSPPLSIAAPRWLLSLAARGDRLLRGDSAKLTPDRAAYMAHPDWTSAPALRPDQALWTPNIAPQPGFAATARWYRDMGWIG
jgi:nucleoside-diphosphate-sugar epimerase